MSCSSLLTARRFIGHGKFCARLFTPMGLDDSELVSSVLDRVAARSLATLAGEHDDAFAWLSTRDDRTWRLSVYAWFAEGLGRLVTIIDGSTGQAWRADDAAFLVGGDDEIRLIAEQWQARRRCRPARPVHHVPWEPT